MKKFSELVDRYRWGILGLGLLITLFFCFQLLNLKVKTDFNELLPQNHPYIKVHNEIRKSFGGANQVLLMLQVRKGDIFNQKTLEKVKYISERLRLAPGVDRNKIRSIATRKSKYFEVSSGNNVTVSLMYPDVPTTEEELDLLRERIYSSPQYYGPSVSLDSKKTLITVDFVAELLDYEKVFEFLSKLRKEVEDENHILNIAGEPMHLGYVNYHNRDIFLILGMTILVIMVSLYFDFSRSFKFMVIPLITAGISGIWGLGFMGLVGYNLDPLILVLPFLISLMTARHSMQLIMRYIEEIRRGASNREAAKTLVEVMFFPGITSIITDAFGVALVAVAAIPILQNIAVTCTFWSVVTVIFSLIFTPIFLVIFPESKNLRSHIAKGYMDMQKEGLLEKVLTRMGFWLVKRGKWVVVVMTVVITAVSLIYSLKIEVGDFVPGSSILWPDHRYNKDALRIAYSMPLLNPIFIMVGGEGFKSKKELEDGGYTIEVDKFQRFVQRHPRVSFVQSIVNRLPEYWSSNHDSNPYFLFIPNEIPFASHAFRSLLYQFRPGDQNELISGSVDAVNVIVYCRDRTPKTLKGVMGHIKGYLERNNLKGTFHLAGGSLGVQAAVREVIAEAQILNLALALLMVFICCALNFRSLTAGVILTVPLFISNLIAFGLMAAYQIGLTVNTFPVSSVGIGLGVDYGIYFIGRLQEEKKKTPDLSQAIVNTLRSNGKSILVIATTLCIGLLIWIFSELRFQAEMGALLAMLLFLNMLGALFLVPSFLAIFKPKFLTKIACTEEAKNV